MIAALSDKKPIFVDFIDETMLAIDTPRPIVRVSKAQRFWFAHAYKRIGLNGFNKWVNPARCILPDN